MLEIVMNEIASLPPMIRQSVELFQSGTIIIPAISLLLYVLVQHHHTIVSLSLIAGLLYFIMSQW